MANIHLTVRTFFLSFFSFLRFLLFLVLLPLFVIIIIIIWSIDIDITIPRTQNKTLLCLMACFVDKLEYFFGHLELILLLCFFFSLLLCVLIVFVIARFLNLFSIIPLIREIDLNNNIHIWRKKLNNMHIREWFSVGIIPVLDEMTSQFFML